MAVILHAFGKYTTPFSAHINLSLIMVPSNISLQANPQIQSRLVCLPMEIKHMITSLCFTADDVVEDPLTTIRQDHDRAHLSLGIALLKTCRRLYHEADRRSLYSKNIFRFTSVDNTRKFLGSLEEEHCLNVNELEIDIRHVHSDRPALGRDWLQYLKDHPEDGTRTSLRKDAPGLRILRLNFESWPRVAMFRAELWNLLRHLLSDVRGLERIVVIGASKGQAMARRAPWSPAHYVGADDIGANDLVPRMWRCVDVPDDKKHIQWIRANGKIQLEVVSGADVIDQRGCDQFLESEHNMGPNGRCGWNCYASHNSIATAPRMK